MHELAQKLVSRQRSIIEEEFTIVARAINGTELPLVDFRTGAII
jgi:hypothetical protein